MMRILLFGCLHESFSREGHCGEQRKPCLGDTLDKFDLCCWCKQAKSNDFKVPYYKSHKAQGETTWPPSGVRPECECWECVQKILIKSFFSWWLQPADCIFIKTLPTQRPHPHRFCSHTEVALPQINTPTEIVPTQRLPSTENALRRDCTYTDCTP